MNHVENFADSRVTAAGPAVAPAGASADVQSQPWWTYPYVWMVIAGPLSAVVACIVTAFYIFSGPDAVVLDENYREGKVISREIELAQPPMQPAHTARNHSATGGKIDAKP
jgi:hypothetical protein